MECDSSNGPNKSTQNEVVQKKVDMDTVFVEDLGSFGLYQVRTVLLLSVAVIFIAWSATEYLFTAARIQTRCLIPECEYLGDGVEFQPEWLGNAVPSASAGDGFDNCQRFANRSITIVEPEDVCPAQLFDHQSVIQCDAYVYENTNTIVYSFDLACDEWRRTFVGTIRSIGVLIALPIVGFISDRWGRRAALAITSINTAWIGVLRYFADTYIGFMVSQFAESVFGGGGFSCAYIIINETCGPKHRIAGSALMSTCFALGQALFGLIAWAVPDWRKLTLTIYIPQFIAIFYFWIMPESARWYLSKQRYKEAEKNLKNVARTNGRNLSEQTLEALKNNVEEEIKLQAIEKQEKKDEPSLVVLVFQNKPMLLRCVVVPIWWIIMTLVYYGLTINAVNISGNPYWNFMAVSLVEIPGFWIGYFTLNHIGRKPTLISSFWVCAACQFGYIFIPDNLYGLSLSVYLIGKCASAVLVMTVYVYTMELFPTKYRHRLFAFSSMMGRIGSIIAPLTPAFGEQVPFILFGLLALVAGILGWVTPETLGARLPDSMREAVRIGNKEDKA